MDFRDYLLTFADYHRWANARLIQRLEPLSDEAYRADQGLFFATIHKTLNHILLVDRLWFARFHERSLDIESLGDELVAERSRLARELDRQAELWREYLVHRDNAALTETLHYQDTRGNPQAGKLCYLIAHVFNHGTHHRGQISAAMTRLGLDAPALDLPYFLKEQ